MTREQGKLVQVRGGWLCFGQIKIKKGANTRHALRKKDTLTRN